MISSSQAVPHFSLFTREQCEAVHYASLEILRRTGVRVDHPRTLALRKNTEALITDGNLVRFPAALAGAPSRIALCRRGLSEPAIVLEEDNVHYGPGSDCSNYLDPRAIQRLLLFVQEAHLDFVHAYSLRHLLEPVHLPDGCGSVRRGRCVPCPGSHRIS